MLKRSEVKIEDTWNLQDIFPSWEALEKNLASCNYNLQNFVKKYRDQITPNTSAELLLQAYRDYLKLTEDFDRIFWYANLDVATDMTDPVKNKRSMQINSAMSNFDSETTFFFSALDNIPETTISEVTNKEPHAKTFFAKILRERPHKLSPEAEKLLAELDNSVISLPENIYDSAKFADLCFPDFDVEGTTYPLSFAKYEETYAYSTDTALRREAFKVFSENLAKYRNTIATGYLAYVKQDVVMAKQRRYDNVFSYLLSFQQVDETLFHRQLDVIMQELAPIMRQYARKIKENYHLDKLTYADLKLPPLPAMDKTVSRAEAREYVLDAVSVMGDDYKAKVDSAFAERWLDFAENIGKSTGGFCAGVHDVHPYILLNWTGAMPDVFTIVHELGHAMADILSGAKLNLSEMDMSMYLVEAPSTCHEMLFAQSLLKKAATQEEKRLAAAYTIASTYYHNFVTHFLEGYWQRKVYQQVAAGAELTADDFDALFLETLQQFWGDEVEMTPGAEKTWMRQPHYYSGLYSYTYSAGLTLGTAVSLAIAEKGEPAAKAWRETLELGGTLPPVELAKHAGVDLTTEKPLRDTIKYIKELVDLI